MNNQKRIDEVLKDLREDNWKEIRRDKKNRDKNRKKQFTKGGRKSINQKLNSQY